MVYVHAHTRSTPPQRLRCQPRRRPSCPPPAGCAATFLHFSATCEVSAVGSLYAQPSVMEREFEVGFFAAASCRGRRHAGVVTSGARKPSYSPLYLWCRGTRANRWRLLVLWSSVSRSDSVRQVTFSPVVAFTRCARRWSCCARVPPPPPRCVTLHAVPGRENGDPCGSCSTAGCFGGQCPRCRVSCEWKAGRRCGGGGGRGGRKPVPGLRHQRNGRGDRGVCAALSCRACEPGALGGGGTRGGGW